MQGLVVYHPDTVCLQRFRQRLSDIADSILFPFFMIIADRGRQIGLRRMGMDNQHCRLCAEHDRFRLFFLCHDEVRNLARFFLRSDLTQLLAVPRFRIRLPRLPMLRV